MTDPYARPADDSGDATIPIVPDAGYAPTEQVPFAEETLIDPAGPRSPWSADSAPDLSAPGYGGSFGAQPTYPPPTAYPTPAAYASTNYTQPQAGYGHQPGNGDTGYGQTGHPPAAYGQPAPQTNYVQPQAAPSQPAPYHRAPTRGFAEPSGTADVAGAQNIYQGYPTAPVAPAQQPAWPAPIHDPVAYDYGYGNTAANLPEHPNATVSMVLGIIGLAFFQLLSPLAWYLAAKGKRQMAESPGRWRPSGSLTAGLVLGIIGTVFLGLAMAFVVGMLMLVIASAGG